ncbi:MAG: YeeE/YedE family protein [Thauera phenolivorans]|uniref:YeeE/YedE family protein n=1 Tax=Thauera phenolivorans TaxID=1792543 RepID=A0A7X7LWT2_9RHOO|nr:YeeE/YedE thiosulfate transporter family protein [Thauera phenolivorans]NLF54698.1 YeeE/YedE family protein [Thauera phenolivorans]
MSTPLTPPPENAPPVLVIPAPAHEQSETADAGKPDSTRQLVLGLLFGVVFGFLLQKGGVARYEVLMGQFLLTDFTVIKVMLTAIIVGMIGIFSLRALGLVELHVKPTRYAANIAGGLLFGVGLGLLGYCPGTGVAALGQGSYDAIAGILGLLAGSYLYAETSGFLGATIQKIGNRGRIMLPDLLGMRFAVFLAVFVPALVLGLFLIAQLAP